MDKYKDYIARTQQDRIFIDILSTLDEINEQLKHSSVSHILSVPTIDTSKTTGIKSVPEITATTAKRSGRKPKGDK